MEGGLSEGPGHKRKIEDQESGEYGHVIKRKAQQYILYIIKNKLTSSRLAHLKSLSIKNGLEIIENYDNTVTHIVTALSSLERVKDVMNLSDIDNSVEIVTVEWLTNSFVEGKPVEITDRYRLKNVTNTIDIVKEQKEKVHITNYECQRATLLNHPNLHITEALEVIEKYYQLLDHKQGDTRALAFRQASCTIKALPKKVSSVDEVEGLHRIGKHSGRIIEDIVLYGSSKEVEDIRNSSWFQCMELFMSIYGCGPATADKWYKQGYRTIEQLKECSSTDLKLTETQILGLTYNEELSQPIPREEVTFITETIEKEVIECCPGTSLVAVGGYRRGKLQSHDVDLLLSHQTKSNTLLETIIEHLKSKDILVHANVSIGGNTLAQVQSTHDSSAQPTYTSEGVQIKRVQFDHLDKAFCVMKLKKKEGEGKTDVIIRRVDLIVAPPDQYPFALVSWTGSKQFNRSLRRYSVKECSMTVTAHGIFDIINRKFLPAKTEQDVFEILKLNYLEPWERNC